MRDRRERRVGVDLALVRDDDAPRGPRQQPVEHEVALDVRVSLLVDAVHVEERDVGDERPHREHARARVRVGRLDERRVDRGEVGVEPGRPRLRVEAERCRLQRRDERPLRPLDDAGRTGLPRLPPARREAEERDAGRVHLGHHPGAEQGLDVGRAEHGRDAEVAAAGLRERAHGGHRLAPQLAAARRDQRPVGDGVADDLLERGYCGSPGTGTHSSPSTSYRWATSTSTPPT